MRLTQLKTRARPDDYALAVAQLRTIATAAGPAVLAQMGTVIAALRAHRFEDLKVAAPERLQGCCCSAAKACEAAGARLPTLLCLAVSCALQQTASALISVENAARAEGLFEDVLELLAERRVHETVPTRRASLWREEARLLEESLGRLEEAEQAYAAALLEVPGDPEIVSARSRCLEALGRYPELLLLTLEQLKSNLSLAEAGLLHTRAGSLFELAHRDEEQALFHYREALRLHANVEPALHGALAIAERQRNHLLTFDLLQERLQLESRRAERAQLLLRLGELSLLELEDIPRGLALAEEAVEMAPFNFSIRLRVVEHLLAQGKLERAERYAASAPPVRGQQVAPRVLAQLALVRAEIAARQERPGEALELLGWVLELGLELGPALGALEALLLKWPLELLPPASLQRIAQGNEGPLTLRASAVRCEGLLRWRLGQLELAQACFARALTFEASEASVRRLGAFLEARRDFEAAVALYRKPWEAGGPSPELTAHAARLLVDHLGQSGDARALLWSHRGALRGPGVLLLHRLCGEDDGMAMEVAALPGAAELEGNPTWAALQLKLHQRRHSSADALAAFEGHAARLGHPGTLRARLRSAEPSGLLECARALEAAVAPEYRAKAAVALAEALEARGELAGAQQMLERAALEAPQAPGLNVIAGMLRLDSPQAAVVLSRHLRAHPFEPRAHELLCAWVAEAPERVGPLLRGFCHGPAAGELRTQEGLRTDPVRAPSAWLGWLQTLRRQAPSSFLQRETSIRQQSVPAPLSPRLRERLERESGGLEVAVLAHPEVGAIPLVLSDPPALVVSSQLLRPGMPEGCLVFAWHFARAMIRGELGPLQYLPAYEMELFAQAVSSINRASLPHDPGWLGHTATCLGEERARVWDWAETVPRAEASEADWPSQRRGFIAGCLASALEQVQDLSLALETLSLRPAASRSWRPGHWTWINQMGCSAEARFLLRYVVERELPGRPSGEMTSGG